MIARAYSFQGSKDYKRVKKEGRLYQSKNFGVGILNREDCGYPRFGFIISNKISKLSTQRNRIKRAFSEALRHNLNKIKKGYDVLFLARPTLERMSTDEIMREVELFIRNSEIYQE